MKYVEVVFGIPLDQGYTYTVDDETPVDIGFRIHAPFGRRMLTGFVVALPESAPANVGPIKAVDKVLDQEPLFENDTLELARWVAKLYLCSTGEVLQTILPGGKRPKSTEDFYQIEEAPEKTYKLAPQQTAAIEKVLTSEDKIFYLNGVTGSGKTEVFLKVAREVMNRGKDVIYLVPEISLTHQVVEVFIQEFGKDIAIIHSGLTPSQKLYEWLRILKGKVQIVIGARSAVFAPLKNLGLIIIDEEHEGSYKSSSTPRYHARQVAVYRCTKAGARLIMGSATPSLEAYYQMKNGNLAELSMPDRLSGGKMPEIKIVDMKREKGSLSRELMTEIQRVHALGRQTILFLNRRGFAYYFHCKSCGYEMKCRNCSVSLTFHKTKWQMVCHYCGFKEKPVDVCPECKSLDVGYSGFGTEKIEEEIKELFPEMSVTRIDTDVVRKKFMLKEILSDFRNEKIDILLGTQMVAKGLNFPKVMLVGIISADTGLQLPDFRASERTFNLIVQVSGRAGRVIPDGKVLIQTFQPQNPAIVLAARGEVKRFYENELSIRKELEFPPFYRLIRLVFRGKDHEAVRKAVRSYYALIPKSLSDFCEILGPVECPLAVIAGNHRYHLIFRTENLNKLHGFIGKSVAHYRKPHNIYVEIDVDPVSLL